MSTAKVSRFARRYRTEAVAATCLCAAWLLVVALSFYSIPLANIWLLGSISWLGGWVLALIVSLTVSVIVWLSHRRLLAVVTLGLALVATATIWSTDWQSLYVHRFYRENQVDFAEALAQYNGVTSSDPYGVPLPAPLRHLSVNGRAASIYSRDGAAGPPALFFPQVLRVPDGGAGYAHVEPGQERDTFDCFMDDCRASLSLGDDWYWLG